MRKIILYRCTSTFSAINNCGGIFFKSPICIYTKWCAQTFPPIFGLFAIFDRNFAIIVAPPSDEYKNYVVLLKEQSLVKKRWKPRPNRPINSNAMFVRTMHTSNARRSGLGAWQTKQEPQLMLTNLRDAFRGQSRSPNIVPFHMLGIVSYCAIVTLSLRCFYDIRLQKMSWPWNWVKGHWRSLRVVSFDRLCMVSY